MSKHTKKKKGFVAPTWLNNVAIGLKNKGMPKEQIEHYIPMLYDIVQRNKGHKVFLLFEMHPLFKKVFDNGVYAIDNYECLDRFFPNATKILKDGVGFNLETHTLFLFQIDFGFGNFSMFIPTGQLTP